VSSYIETPDGAREPLPSKVTRMVDPGTRIALRTAGGGGYGDPKLRDPQKVREDVREGFIDTRRAREQYGVVIDTDSGEVDRHATNELRSMNKSE
jgi:N-methylhydantoinase B